MRRRFAIDAAGLGIGAAVNGIAVYGYAAIGSRVLGAVGFAPVSVLWTFWAVTGAAVAFPIQHWVIRRIHADGSEAGVRRALPRMAGIVAALAIISGVVAWLERGDLFRRGDLLFPASVSAIVIGTAVMGVLRGGLAARGRFAATAAAFAGESLLRLSLAAVGAAAGWGVEIFAVIMLAGFGVVLIWPGALRFARSGPADTNHQLGFLVGISTGSLLAQFVLTGAPVAMALAGAAEADITSAFAALALFRAPYLLGLGVASRITGTLTSFVVGQEHSRLRVALGLTIGGAVLAACVGAGAGLTVAAPLLRLLFGPEIDLPRGALVLFGAGSGIALGTLVQGLVLISRARWLNLVGVWSLATFLGVAWIVAGPGPVVIRAATGFLLAESLSFAMMLWSEASALKGSEPSEASLI